MAFGRPPYIKSRGVQGHPGNILTLAVSEDSKILASGGTWTYVTAALVSLNLPKAMKGPGSGV